MGYDIVQTEAVSEFRDVFVALRTGLPLVFGELLFEQKCTVVVATPNLAAKNDFPRSHLHHVQYYVTDYIPAAQTYVNTFPRPSLPSEWVWERDYFNLATAAPAGCAAADLRPFGLVPRLILTGEETKHTVVPAYIAT